MNFHFSNEPKGIFTCFSKLHNAALPLYQYMVIALYIRFLNFCFLDNSISMNHDFDYYLISYMIFIQVFQFVYNSIFHYFNHLLFSNMIFHCQIIFHSF